MRWECSRGCGAGGAKTYASADEASRYARGLERDRTPAGEGRAAPISTLPLRLVRRLRRSEE
jgi:hypothetical protein